MQIVTAVDDEKKTIESIKRIDVMGTNFQGGGHNETIDTKNYYSVRTQNYWFIADQVIHIKQKSIWYQIGNKYMY